MVKGKSLGILDSLFNRYLVYKIPNFLGFYIPCKFFSDGNDHTFMGRQYDLCNLHREMAAGDESGIEGILNRLERQRNLSFGFDLRSKGNGTSFPSIHAKDDRYLGTSIDAVS